MTQIEPSEFLREIIDPACAALTGVMGQEMGDDRARTMLLAIAYQESNLEHRRQIRGPARGFWQFEKMGGTVGVLTHERTRDAAEHICEAMGVEAQPGVVYEALASDDNLAACFARLLLWSDPRPLPPIGDENGAWDYYLRNWRPGKPHRARWSQCHAIAVNTVLGGEVPVIAGTAQVIAVSAPSLPAPAVKPGTLTTTGAKEVVVDLPKMNRAWKTGEFWLNIGGTLLYAAILLSPLIEPQLDKVAENPMLLAIPGGPVLFGIARQWYKAQRVKAAAGVATAAQVGGPA
jgi:hypothetical protein